jgi:hypothetical protein
MLSEGVSPPSGNTKTVFHAGFIMEVKQNLTATCEPPLRFLQIFTSTHFRFSAACFA